MKKIIAVLLLSILLFGCGGGSDDPTPSEISGTWYGENQIGVHWYAMTATFSTPDGIDIHMEALLDSSAGNYWRIVGNYIYENGQFTSPQGLHADVHSNFIDYYLIINDRGVVINGTITLFRQ